MLNRLAVRGDRIDLVGARRVGSRPAGRAVRDTVAVRLERVAAGSALEVVHAAVAHEQIRTAVADPLVRAGVAVELVVEVGALEVLYVGSDRVGLAGLAVGSSPNVGGHGAGGVVVADEVGARPAVEGVVSGRGPPRLRIGV